MLIRWTIGLMMMLAILRGQIDIADYIDNDDCAGDFHNRCNPPRFCKRRIEMTPLCKIEVTHPRVLGSREVRRGGVVDEQTGVQPS
jgi:hypothetical protein